MPGQVDGSISCEALPSINAVFKLDQISDDEFGPAPKSGSLWNLVIIQPDSKLNSSSLMNDCVLRKDDTLCQEWDCNFRESHEFLLSFG